MVTIALPSVARFEVEETWLDSFVFQNDNKHKIFATKYIIKTKITQETNNWKYQLVVGEVSNEDLDLGHVAT